MLYTFTVVANFIAMAVAIWLGIYIVTGSSRSGIAWLAGLALWSIAGFFFNEIMTRFYISEGTFNRTRRAAIRSLVRTLSGMESAVQ
jgi:hypothetical protein